MLSKTFLRSPLCFLLLAPFFFHVMVPPALAADFGASVESGRAIGSGLVTDFNPKNLNQTLQNKGLGASESLTPKINEARQNKGDYSGFYNNPGGMGSASSDPNIETFVNDIYNNRQKYDLTQDATFGSKCLETGADGKCTMWSASKDLVTNTYKDCEKVLILTYDEPASEATCSGSNQITTTQCDVTTYAHAVTEDLALSCDQYTPDYRPGQIYAFCKDIYKWYKVYAGTGREADDCSCENHSGALCYTPPLFEVVSQAPEGPTYLGMSYENFYDRGSKSGWDDCTSDRYYWYVKYDKSVVERLFLQKDSPCGGNMEKWAQECAVSRLEQCDPSGNNCVVSIEDGQNTGQMPDLNYLTKVLQGVFTESTSTSCAYVYDYTNDYWYWSCPTGEICVSGSCSASAVMLSSPSSSSMQIGEGHANFSLSSDQAQVSYDKYLYFKDPRVCQDFAGSLDNYVICLKYYSIDLNDSAGRKTLTQNPETVASSYSYYGSLIHQKRVYGGPDVPDHLNNWRSRVTFGCEETTDTCQALRDQGCVPYKTECLDSNCDQLRYTYHCGGTGGVKSYQVAYNCLGEIRCLGTECTDASYNANTDFAAVAAAMEVLNNYRADATATEIFPGEVQTCQKSPKNCCKSPGGLSIGDYVTAGKAAISAYSMYSGGLSATWAGYANAFTYALTEGSAGGLQGLLGTTVSDYLGTTTTTLYTSPSFYTEQLSQSMSYLTEIGVDVAQTEGGAALTASTELVSALATVATVVCIALIRPNRTFRSNYLLVLSEKMVLKARFCLMLIVPN